ncbi:VirD4-like conjugal transfer protein, CD1115 family [Arcanobacterium bovis]|uniref:Type IV secretory system conjugative DNA transfer family protein n=1 Tax=Arcanobacterium bovis TaxID=2529275 RepID=A0A4Q9UYM5_9ACTO|nr:type IV secretory system conjugative DNA transfer family protein [Arcanobacterium bovis]TBW20774.1 type IV secretory system conjugative DNA transfer family protein [Arcanobacterium bovis]
MKPKYLINMIIVVAGFYISNKLSFQIRSGIESRWPPEMILDHALDDFTNLGQISFQQTDILIGLATAFIIALVILAQTFGKKPRRDGEEHGSASWASRRDIKPYRDPNPVNNILFTKTEALSLDSRRTQRNLNVLVDGGSGSGKSRYFVFPNLCQANTSYAVTDPKGELYRQAGKYLQTKGYKVRCLNLVDFSQSERFNPLKYFSDHQPEVDATVLVENIISNTNGTNTKSSGDFWEKAERALLNALVSYVFFTKGHTGTLIDVVDLLAQMQASENDETKKSDVDLTFDAVNDLIDEYDTDPYKNEWGQEAVEAVNGLRFAASQYNTYTQGAGETKKSVIISLGVRMAPLHMASMRTLLSEDTIELDRIGQEKTALFMIIPDTHAAFNFLISIFYEQLFETNIYIADHTPNGHLPVHVQCLMDEFANIGQIPSFERKIAVMRSRGISTAIIIQNMAQGKALYKDSWETIVGNCDSFLFLGGTEKSTTEYVSKMLGKQTIASLDHSQSKGRSGSWSESERTLGRELLTPDEIGRLPAKECIYILRGIRPFKSRKLDAPNFG